MIKAVIFDLDDTLYEYENINKVAIGDLCQYTCNLFGIKEELFKEAFEYGRQTTKNGLENVAAAHNRIIYCQKALEYLKVNSIKYSLEMYNVYWDSILKNMKLNDGVIEVLSFLKERGIRIGICTDLTTNIQHRKIRQLGIEEYIDYIVTSEEAGEEKPGEKMFNLILNKLKVNSNQAVYVGDNFNKDVIGSFNVGMVSVWYNPHKKRALTNNIKYKEIDKLQKLKDYII